MKYFPDADRSQAKLIEIIAKTSVGRLADRFRFRLSDIGPENFYLSFSGGFESYLLFWFIRLSGMYSEGYKISVVSAINFMMYPQVVQRIRECADAIVYPAMDMGTVKERYGIPCFNKRTDSIIHRYQSGSRRPYLMRKIYGINTAYYKLNNTAGYLLTSGKLHRVSPYCCTKTKEEPLTEYGKQHGKRPILGVRKTNSLLRGGTYQQCMQKSGAFSPLYDFTDLECLCMYDYFNIERIYPYTRDSYSMGQFDQKGRCGRLTSTGCLGCPYAGKRLYKEFADMTSAQREYAARYFGESYDVIGFDYRKYL